MTLSELKARVDAAEGGDRELDEALALAMGWETGKSFDDITGWENVWRSPKGMLTLHVPAYTSSLDASLALVEAKLPGWGWTITQHKEMDGGWRGNLAMLLDHKNPNRYPTPKAICSTPSLALLSALLAALMAEEVPA